MTSFLPRTRSTTELGGQQQKTLPAKSRAEKSSAADLFRSRSSPENDDAGPPQARKTGAWDHEKGRRRDDDGRPKRRDAKPRRGRSDVPMATYTIAVGKRHKVEPRQIVGAIANEGGLSSSQIGGIDIRADHTLVELPAELSKDQWRALSKTRIGGELIHLELDKGRRPNRERPAGDFKKPHRKGEGDFRAERSHGGDFRSEGARNDRGFGSDDRKARHKKGAGAGTGRRDKW